MKTIWKDKHNHLRTIWAILYGLLALALPIIGTGLLAQIIFPYNDNASQYLAGFMITPIAMIASNLFIKKFYPQTLTFFDLNKRIHLKYLLIGAIAGFLILSVNIGLLLITKNITIVYHKDTLFSVGAGFFMFLGMGMIEECVFRGIFLAAFSKFHWTIAMVASSLLFSFCHMDLWMDFQIIRVLELFVFGLLMTISIKVFRSTAFALGAHVLSNVTEVVFYGIDSESGIFLSSYTNGTMIPNIISIGVNLFIICIFLLYGRKKGLLMKD